ncbi:contactin-4-like isoform X2 [Clytia hemisphaerica]|uniref:Uncharacterized protein n=1 Tax=Clytia hemisphaerica TaxID=252671 RepID=A0A7M5V4S6_9CNID
MTWLSTFYLRAFVVLLQITCILSNDDYGPLPGFKQQPIDTLIESHNQSVVCSIRGEKPLTVTWRKENLVLDSKKLKYLSVSKEGSITLYNTQRGRDEGNWRCQVSNSYGTVLSRSAKVTFPYMNEFSEHDLRITIEEGQPALLACYAPDSYPDRYIHWLKLRNRGHFPLQLDTNSHFTTSLDGDLYFSYTTRSDEGVYYCSVENSKLRRFERRTVSLKVTRKARQSNAPPKIWEFSDRIAMKDSNFVLECIAYGRPVPVMRFRNAKTGEELSGSRQIGNRLRYQFGRFGKQHEGEYLCEAENAYGEKANKTAYLKMESQPEIMEENEFHSIDRAIDSELILPCVAKSIPQASYTWLFNAAPIDDTKNKDIEIHQGTLKISKLMKYHQGFYQCIAHNQHGEDLKTIYVTVVEYAPDFKKQSSIPPATSTQALIGGTAIINCVPNGAPVPKVYWKKLNTTLDVVTFDPRVRQTSIGSLEIRDIKKSDEGIYVCVATNKLGTDEAAGELKVNGGLAITEPLSDVSFVRTGNTITLTCKYNSNENVEIKFEWKFGRRTIRRTRRYNIKSSKIKRQSILTIKNAVFKDTGLYTCKVVGTKQRSAEKTQRITVSGPPDPPTHVTATDLSGLNIKISWSLGRENGAPTTKVYIQARTSFDLDVWHTIKVSNKTEGYRFSEIVEMSPWIEFRIRVISENKHGKSKPSEETSKWIRTPTAKPMKYPTNIHGKGSGPSELTVSFDPLDEIDQNAPGIEYIVHYREKGTSYGLIQRKVPKDQHSLKLSFINDDSYYRPYEFQIQAKNKDGYGPMSPVHIAYTGERVPITVPTNLKVKLDDEMNAVALWDEVSKTRNAMRGKFQGYKFIYWKEPKENYPVIERYEVTKAESIQVRLKAHSTYYFQVLAFNNVGDGPRSIRYGAITTPEGIPTPPTNFKIIDASQGEVTLSWTEPLHKNGVIEKYLLTYISMKTNKKQQGNLRSDERTFKLKNLAPNEPYLFKLAAVTGAGISEESEISFDLSKVPSYKLEAPIVKSIGYNAIVLTWLAVAPTVDISGYKLFYRKENEAEEKALALWEQSNDIVSTVHNLDSGTTYYFQIAVVNQYGTGPKSKVTIAATKFKEGEPPRRATEAGKQSTSVKLTLSSYLVGILVLIALLVPR